MLNLKNLILVVVFLIAVAIASFLGFKLYVGYQVKKKVDELTQSLWSVAKIEYAGLDTSLDGHVKLTGVVVRPFEIDDEIKIGAIEVHVPDLEFLLDSKTALAAGKIPEKMTLSISDVVIDATGNLLTAARQSLMDSGGDARLCLSSNGKYAMLHDLGYGHLRMNAELGYTYNKNDFTLQLYAKGEEEGIGKYDFNAVVQLPLSKELAAGRLAGISLSKAGLNYTDINYHQKLIAHCSTTLGQTPEQFLDAKVRQSEIVAFPRMMLGAGLKAAYKVFLQAGGTVNITVNPVPALKLVNLIYYTPQDMVKVLNLAVAVNDEPVRDLTIEAASLRTEDKAEMPMFSQLPSLKSLAEKVLGEELLEKENKPDRIIRKEQVIRYESIALADMSKYLGRWVKVLTMTDFVRTGRLDSIKDGEVVVSWKVGRGEMAANIPLNRVKKVELVVVE